MWLPGLGAGRAFDNEGVAWGSFLEVLDQFCALIMVLVTGIGTRAESQNCAPTKTSILLYVNLNIIKILKNPQRLNIEGFIHTIACPWCQAPYTLHLWVGWKIIGLRVRKPSWLCFYPVVGHSWPTEPFRTSASYLSKQLSWAGQGLWALSVFTYCRLFFLVLPRVRSRSKPAGRTAKSTWWLIHKQTLGEIVFQDFSVKK